MNIQQRDYQITIGGTDVSALVVGWDVGAPPLDQSGLFAKDGSITIAAYPAITIAIDTDPRTNVIWQAGSTVVIEIADLAGDLQPFFTGRILRTPSPANRGVGGGTFDIEVVDEIAYRLDRDPQGDNSEVDLGSSTSKIVVVQRLLQEAGFSGPSVTLAGTFDAPVQKANEGSFTSQAGQICNSGFAALFADASGNVSTIGTRLNTYRQAAPLLTVNLGNAATGEISYEYENRGANPANQIVAEGERQIVEAIENPVVSIDRVPFDLATLLPPWAMASDTLTGWVYNPLIQTTDTWTGNTHTIAIQEGRYILFPAGLRYVNRTETTVESYDSRGRLRRVITTRDGIWSDMRVQLWGILNPPPFETPVTLSQQVVEVSYGEDDVIRERTTINYEGGYVSLEELSVLRPVYRLDERWQRRFNGYEYRRVEFKLGRLLGSIAELADSLQLASIKTENGQQPPGTQYRKPIRDWQSEPIEGSARFATQTGATYERYRAFSVPYCETSQDLTQHAKELGGRLWGESQGAAIALPIYDELIDAPPLFRLDVVEQDGKVISYLAHGHNWSFENDRRTFETNLMFLGIVRSPGTTPVPYWIEIEDASFGGSGGIAIDQLLPIVPGDAEFGGSGGIIIRAALPPIAIEFGGSGGQEFTLDPIFTRLSFGGSGGIDVTIEEGIPTADLTIFLDPALGVTSTFDPTFEEYDVTWDSQESLARSIGTIETRLNPEVADAFGTGLDGIQVNDATDEPFRSFDFDPSAITSYITDSTFTLFMVVKVTAIASAAFERGDPTSGTFGLWGDTQPEIQLVAREFDSQDEISIFSFDTSGNEWKETYQAITLGDTYLVTAWQESGTLYLQLNDGTPTSVTAPARATTTGGLRLGSQTGQGAEAVYGHILTYSASLTMGDRETVQNELNTIYGLWTP